MIHKGRGIETSIAEKFTKKKKNKIGSSDLWQVYGLGLPFYSFSPKRN